MRAFVILLALLVASPSCAFAQSDESVASLPGASLAGPAPADEYFGRLKMSILGIRNQLAHLSREAEQNPEDGDGIVATMQLTEDSVKEWEQHYPSDPWLEKTVYGLVHVYAKIPGESAHESAVRTLAWLLSKYPQSEFIPAAAQEVGQVACSH